MIKNLRLNPLLYGFIPLFSCPLTTNSKKDKYNTQKLWPDYKKCSRDSLLNANKISADEYMKLKTYCDDSLLKFQKKCDDEEKLRLEKSTMCDIYKLNGKVPREQIVYKIIKDELDRVLTLNDINDIKKLINFINYNSLATEINYHSTKLLKIIEDRLEKILISNNVGELKKLVEFLKSNNLIDKIKYDFTKFLKINNLDDSYLYFKILSDSGKATIDDYKNIFANLLKKDMEFKCKNRQKISLDKYKKKYLRLSTVVELVFVEVAKKNIKCCDLREIEILAHSAFYKKLLAQKIEQLIIDAMANDDIITMIDLINNHLEKISLSLLAKKLNNKYVIDHLLNNIVKKERKSFTTGELYNKILQEYIISSKYAETAITLLFFMSCYYGDDALVNCIINFEPLQVSKYYRYDFFDGCRQIIKGSYLNDDYDLFVKYSNMLKKFPDYTTLFTLIQINNDKTFEQKNNYLELIGTHIIKRPVQQKSTTNDNKNDNIKNTKIKNSKIKNKIKTPHKYNGNTYSYGSGGMGSKK